MVNPGYPSDHLQRFIAEAGMPARALEMGCGAGANLDWLTRERRWRPTTLDAQATVRVELDAGIEKDEAAAAYARAWLDGYAMIVTGDIAELPFPAQSFDLVFDIEAIYQNDWPTIQKIANEAYRVLKPGGWFFGQMMRDAFDPKRPELSIGYRFTHAELLYLFQGMKPITIDHAIRTWDNGSGRIAEWLVRARKPE